VNKIAQAKPFQTVGLYLPIIVYKEVAHGNKVLVDYVNQIFVANSG